MLACMSLVPIKHENPGQSNKRQGGTRRDSRHSLTDYRHVSFLISGFKRINFSSLLKSSENLVSGGIEVCLFAQILLSHFSMRQ